MTIEKRTSWGELAGGSRHFTLVHSDREAALLVTAARRQGHDPPDLALGGGDLARTMGATRTEERLESGDARRVPVDLGVAIVDGERHWFVAHAVARRSWWRGRVVAIMNAEWLGRWDAAPRAHPNDGLLDVVDAQLRFDDRLKARRRLPLGTHLPHPAIAVRRTAGETFRFARPVGIYLDGERVGRARSLSVEVEPDALRCIV